MRSASFSTHVSFALLELAPLALLALLAGGCSQKNDHPANAGGCGADANCLGTGPVTGGGGGGGGSDSGTSGDIGGDAGQISIGVGHVAVVTSYALTPESGAATSSATMTVRGLRSSTFSSAPVSGGTFTLGGLDDTAPINWLYLDELVGTTTQTHTIYGFVSAASGGSYDLTIPVFPDTLPTNTAASVGFVPDTGSLSGSAAVVVQIVDAAGLPVKGATADVVPGRFYDDGADGFVASGAGTGARGTILWLGVGPSAGFTIVFTVGAARISIVPQLKADAVTYVKYHP